MESEKLIQTLIEQTRQNMNAVENLKELDTGYLNSRLSENSWSILECIEHLNLYGDFYLPALEKNIQKSTTIPSSDFNTGFLGNYFANSMLPKPGSKMKTFKDKDPIYTDLNRAVIDNFINQQIKLLKLIELSRSKNLNSIRIPISITTLIKLKLGDTFRFLINHNIRHIHQIETIKSHLPQVLTHQI
ncbi:DinB family protein [Pedobacter arcticus]|uniref:DinB family protein n=1 Tax=Pedobacter arcticus TaxID=752140 RepID=UPI00030392DE|nr:DinB family protein [Pedobacter arcticus]